MRKLALSFFFSAAMRVLAATTALADGIGPPWR